MGDQNTLLTAPHARHLLRRSGFGALAEQVDGIVGDGLTRGQAADQLLSFNPSKFKPGGRYIDNKHDKWIKFMVKTPLQVQEKLVLFWHDHFACSDDKVGNPKTMALQNRLLRVNCKGNFKALLKAVNRDAAMIEFLDTTRNRREIPNENYARELQELFALGVKDAAGVANYTQADIVQIARAFTGWSYSYRSGASYMSEYSHDYTEDYPERGPKVIYTTTGGFGPGGQDISADGEGPLEIDRVIDIICAHTDSQGHNTVARYIARKLFSYFAYADVPQSAVDAVVAQSAFDASFELQPLLRAIFVSDAFYESAAPAPFTAMTKKSVKWPVDYVVSTLRMLHMQLKGKYQILQGGTYERVRDELANMGQILFQPPSVFGWDWETAWISSSTMLARYGFATDVTASRYGSLAFDPEPHVSYSLSDPVVIVTAAAAALGIDDQLTAAEQTVLVNYLTDSGLHPSVNLNDEDIRNTKLNGLFALLMQSAAYQLH